MLHYAWLWVFSVKIFPFSLVYLSYTASENSSIKTHTQYLPTSVQVHIEAQQITISSFLKLKSYSSRSKATAFSLDLPLLLLPSRIQAPEQPCTGCPEDHHAEALLISGPTEDAVFHYISQFEHKFPLHVIVGTPSNLMHLAHLIYGLLELLN